MFPEGLPGLTPLTPWLCGVLTDLSLQGALEPHKFCPQGSPPQSLKVLRNHGSVIKTRVDTGSILLTKLQTLFRFHQFFTHVLLYQDRFQVPHCIWLSPLFNLLQSVTIPSHSFSFMSLMLWDSTGQVFCRLSLSLRLLDVFS